MIDSALLPQRFWDKVVPEPLTGCWLWVGACNNRGYGQINVKNKRLYVHRLSYETFVGPLVRELQIDHLCRTPSCCNPDHLEQVTAGTNVRRGMAAKPRPWLTEEKTHCARQHEFTPDNTYYATSSRNPERKFRMCKTCSRVNALNSYYKHIDKCRLRSREYQRGRR